MLSPVKTIPHPGCSRITIHNTLFRTVLDSFFVYKQCLILTHILIRSKGLKVKMSWWIFFLQTHSFSHYKSGVDYLWIIVVFISCLDSCSHGTHSLRRVHWWASELMLNFFKSILMKKQLIYILDGQRVGTFSADFPFGWTILLRTASVFH